MSKKVVCHDINYNEEEVDISKLDFRPSVYGVLIEKNKVLLSKQFGGYDFPGGGIEIHETIDEALEREFFEETGLKVKKRDLLICESSFFMPKHNYRDKYWNCVLIYFLVEKISGELSKDNLDENEKKYADMPVWIEIEDMGKIKFYNSVDNVEIVKKAFERLK